MINNDIIEISNQAGLRISENDNVLGIRHKFCISNASSLGILCFLIGGLFFITISVINISDIISKIIGIILGLLLLIVSSLTLIRQIVDGLEIKDNVMIIRYNLRRVVVSLNKNMKIRVSNEMLKIRRVGSLGSDFIITTYYLHDGNKEIPILRFQIDNKLADNSRKLCTYLTSTIKFKF